METHYGIAINNRFMPMIGIDDDPIQALKKKGASKAKKKEKGKEENKKTANQSDSKEKEQVVQKKEEKERVNSAKPTSKPSERGGRREPRETRDDNVDRRPPRRQGPRDFKEHKGDENVPPEFRERPEGSSRGFNREFGERGRGRGLRRGGFRGGRGGRGGYRGDHDSESRGQRQGFGPPPGERKRDFDRHSGSDKTGIKAVEKKDGGGARNWGSYKDDMVEPHENETPVAEESTENTELNESGEAPPTTEVEDQPKQMTLDEWKALQKNERSKPIYKIRKPGEGEDSGQWNKGTAYNKKRTESEGEGEEEEEREEDKRHINKNILDIKITFNDPVRRGRGGRRPRDGRGRGRGMGRGMGRMDRKPRDSAPRMDDETDFPRLVKTEA